MSGFWRDLRYAARTLARSPGFVLVATLSLGLGMGVNTSLFAAVKAVLFTGASASAPDRLVRVWIGGKRSVSFANLRDVRAAVIFDDVAGYQLTTFSVRAGAEAEKAVGEIVTANYFDVLGVRAAIGRTFSSPDADPNRAPAVAVLSHRYWKVHFGGDPDVVGRSVRVNGETRAVVGVLPADFRSIEGFGIAPEMYLPVSRTIAPNYEARTGLPLNVVGRLKDGTTRQQTTVALTAFVARLERAHPDENRGVGRAGVALFGVSAIEQLREAGGVAASMAVAVLFVLIAGTVLLIACGNVAALLLARGAQRRHEIAVRLALGAGRARVVRQLLAESLLLALLGVACGWLLTLWTIPLLAYFDVPLPIPLPVDYHLDQGLGLLPLEAAMAVIAMLLCGLAPALESTRLAPGPALKESPGHAGARPSRRRNLRVVWQVAGAMMQLVIAAVFLRTLAGVTSVDPGFDADRVLVAEITLDGSRFAGRQSSYAEDAVRRVSALPGVEAASAASLVPLNWSYFESEVNVEGRPGVGLPAVKTNFVAPAYFQTLGIRLVRGRDFAAADRAGSPEVAIASETLAGHLFPDGGAIGGRIRIDGKRTAEIVGVVRDSKWGSLAEPSPPLVYRPIAQEPDPPGTLVYVRAGRPSPALAKAIRLELAGIEKDVPATVRPLRSYVEASMVPIRIAANALAVMGALGLLLALVGLYGLISHGVTQRIPEFGIRLALGSSPALLRRGVLRKGLVLVGSGLVLGLGLALVVTRALTNLVAGLRIDHPLVVLAPAVLLLVAGLAASYLPARRATRVDPVDALRHE